MRSISAPISTLTPDETSWRRLGNVHWGPLIAALLLSVAGVATIQSATAEVGGGYAPRQALWVLVGLVACLVVFAVDYHTLVDAAPVLYGLGLVLLVVVLLFGSEAGGVETAPGTGFSCPAVAGIPSLAASAVGRGGAINRSR